jgi:hypothetical protein
MLCPKCGKEVTGSPAYCPSCGARLTEGQVAKRRGLRTVAGVLDIIDGGLSLLAVFGLTIAMIAVASESDRNADEVDPLIILAVIAVPLLALCILAIMGGVCALRGKNWGMALAGAIAAALPFSLVGIAALILTALSRDEFE